VKKAPDEWSVPKDEFDDEIALAATKPKLPEETGFQSFGKRWRSPYRHRRGAKSSMLVCRSETLHVTKSISQVCPPSTARYTGLRVGLQPTAPGIDKPQRRVREIADPLPRWRFLRGLIPSREAEQRNLDCGLPLRPPCYRNSAAASEWMRMPPAFNSRCSWREISRATFSRSACCGNWAVNSGEPKSRLS
jgi:hypothetical protein